MGVVFDIQRFSLHDGPGIRTTVFLKGCPLACAWCHNPEGIAPRPEVLLVKGRCLGCGACGAVCPEAVRTDGVVTGGPGGAAAPLDGARCRRCGACVEACPAGARRKAGREMTATEVVAEVARDRVFYEESGGGATFSGGEPLLQFDFLLELLDGCRAERIHTTLDTCGHAPRAGLLEAAARADLVLYDLKSMDPERHRAATGVDNAGILANLRALADTGTPIWLRVPVIRGFNDDLENALATARLAAPLDSVRRVSLLPYHALGRHKAGAAAPALPSAGFVPPSAACLEALACCYRERGLEVRIGG
jgi:pyruvate formate lyase activating enzyme